MVMPRLLLTAVLALLPAAAFADDFTVYQVQGVLDNGYSQYSLGGTATLDTTSGVFTASSMAITSPNGTLATFNYGAGASLFVSDPSLPGSQELIFYSFPPTGRTSNVAAEFFIRLLTPPSPGQTLHLCSIAEPCGTVLVPPAGNFENYSSYLLSFYGMFGQYASAYALDTGQFSPLPAATTTPEPSSLLLLGTGLVATCAAFRRRIVR